MTDEFSRGWSHGDIEPALPLCEDHTATTQRLDNHRANQIARQCLKCIARSTQLRFVSETDDPSESLVITLTADATGFLRELDRVQKMFDRKYGAVTP